MDRHRNTICWLLVISFLFLTTFGSFWCSTFIISLVTFLVGLLSLLYIYKGNVEQFYRTCSGNPLTENVVSDGGLQQILKQTINPNKAQKTDSRVTGSEIIDSSLHEILDYIIRDYVSPWYCYISTDEEFTSKAIKRSAQRVAINISNRVKNVDWIPYLTTRLVDDAASHLKLFKQARTKMKLSIPKSPRNSPRRDLKSSPKRAHKRTKSETDALSRNFSGRNEGKRDVGQCSTFYTPEIIGKQTLEDLFFELEFTMEKNKVCRNLICTNSQKEKEFLSELVEYILYFLLPDEDFECKPLRYLLREVFANGIVLPLITMLSDPDYINQAIIWLCLRETVLPSEIFLTTLRITDNSDELRYTKELVLKEIQSLRSRDCGGESDLSIKQQLSSLSYVTKMIDNRLAKMSNLPDVADFGDYEENKPSNAKTIDLPLDVILKNNVALSYFIDYGLSISKPDYLFFYLNIDGWKESVEQQLSSQQLLKSKGVGTTSTSGNNENIASITDDIRAAAMSIYEQYLGDKAEHKIEINSSLVHKLYFRIKTFNEDPSETWFDEIQQVLFEHLKEEFLPGFKKHRSYFKMLEEFDLLQQNVIEEDTLSVNSNEIYELNGTKDSNTDKSSNMDLLTPDSCEKISGKHARSLSDVPYLKADQIETDSASCPPPLKIPDANSSEQTDDNMLIHSGDFSLSVKIIETGIVSEKGKTFGIYATHVSRQYDYGFLEEWHIYRRYSDFHDLHCKIKEKYSDLSKITFPGKKTFHNMDRAVLEKRMKMLGCYMQEITQDYIIHSHPGLRDLLMLFLEQGDYDRATSGRPIANTIGTIVNPIKSGMKSIKNMPEQLMHTVDEVVDKVFHPKTTPVKQQEASKVGAYLDTESDDNIPLRIMLLLVDEVFDLKSRNQWLRRNIVTILRQIVRTMFGDIVNRRILDYVAIMTSPKNVAHYLHMFKHSLWPNGIKAEIKAERDAGSKFRTRVAAKVALLSCLTDELRHIIGSETTRKGLLTVFELFQRPTLNRRLAYVLLEGVLCKLFPEKEKPIENIFQKLYSKSDFYQEREKVLKGVIS